MKAQNSKLRNRMGGALIEYALITALAAVACTAMATYIQRGFASIQGIISKIGVNH